jgi:hypothetical protein
MRTAPASTGKQPQPNRMQPPAPGSAWLVLLVSLVWALGGASRSGFTASVIFSGPVPRLGSCSSICSSMPPTATLPFVEPGYIRDQLTRGSVLDA